MVVAKRQVVQPEPAGGVAGNRVAVLHIRVARYGPVRDAYSNSAGCLARNPCRWVGGGGSAQRGARVKRCAWHFDSFRGKQHADVCRSGPALVLPDRPRTSRVVIPGNHVNRTVRGGQEVGGLSNFRALDPVVLKRVAGQDEEVRALLSGDFDDPASGLETSTACGFRFLSEMHGFHADLPIGRMNKSHKISPYS